MALKFSPGDTICLAHPKDSGWTHRADLRKGQLGKVLVAEHEHGISTYPAIVLCQFPGVSDAWCVYESELEFAEEAIPIDISALL